MIDKVTAEQDVSWLGARLREPSTYAGLSLLFAAFFHFSNATALAGNVQTIGIGLGMIIGGVLAIMLPEGKVRSAGKLVILLALTLAMVFFLFAPRPAHAQTVASNAAATITPPTTGDCTLTECTTFYLGGNVVNDGGNFDVVGSGLSGLASNGVMFGGQAGAEFWNGQWFAAIEGDAEYALTLNAPNNVGLGLSNSWALGAQVKLGYGLASLFGASTAGTSAPTLPSALQSALISPYIAVGVWDRPWGAGLATGAGVQAAIAQNWTLDAEYLHVNFNNAAVNPDVNEQTENLFLVGLNRHFAF